MANPDVIKSIRAMAVEVAVGDFGGLRDWKCAIINEGLQDPARQLDPYENLILAVLNDAISRLTKPPSPHSQDNRTKRARDNALRWIQSDREDHVMDFVSICEHFGWAPSNIRKRIEKLIQQTKTETKRVYGGKSWNVHEEKARA